MCAVVVGPSIWVQIGLLVFRGFNVFVRGRFICIHCVDAGLYLNRSSLIREALRRFMVSEGMSTRKTALGKFAATLVSIMISWVWKAVTGVILFGSVARGEATVESDINLLVLVENAEGWMVRQRLYDLIYPVIPALGVDVSLIVVDKKVSSTWLKKGIPLPCPL